MADENRRIEEFWAWFATHKLELSRLTLDAPFWDTALEKIKKVDEHLKFELSRDSDPQREFIVTAKGHVSSFPIAENLVCLAPNIEGWVFVALKPAKGFQFTTTYEGMLYDPRHMWFLPLESHTRPDDLGGPDSNSGTGPHGQEYGS